MPRPLRKQRTHLAQVIYDRRRSLDLSQTQLSELVGAHRSSLGQWETGDMVPDSRQLQKLSEILKLPVEALLDESKSVMHIDINDLEPQKSELLKDLVLLYMSLSTLDCKRLVGVAKVLNETSA